MQGIVDRVKLDRDFGFIRIPGERQKVYFRREDLNGLDFDEQLRERRVEFGAYETPKGLRAANVTAAKD